MHRSTGFCETDGGMAADLHIWSIGLLKFQLRSPKKTNKKLAAPEHNHHKCWVEKKTTKKRSAHLQHYHEI